MALPSSAAAVAVLAMAALASSPGAAADAARGAGLYQGRCGGCHSVAANRIGPRHAGVVGRKAGALVDFAYSPALKAAGFVWTAEQLDQWLQGPGKLVPGTRMFFTVKEPADRADIIAYLQSVSP
jgi:cytochrome c